MRGGLQSFGSRIEGLEARVTSQASDISSIELDSNKYQIQPENIEYLLKCNSQLKRQVKSSMSPACSPRKPAPKRPLVNSKESLDEVCIDVMEVEIHNTTEHLEESDWKKSLWTCPSKFSHTNTSIANFFAGTPKNHFKVGIITVQDELKQM